MMRLVSAAGRCVAASTVLPSCLFSHTSLNLCSAMDSQSVACSPDACENVSLKEDIRRRKKRLKETPIQQLSRQELEGRVAQLEAHNTQLTNLLAKSQCAAQHSPHQEGRSKQKKRKEFDFSKYVQRHVLLKFVYLGWDYQGYAAQVNTQQTIETQLFAALTKTNLIESRQTCNYHRCGRTDKGVSAFDQVVSLTVRSKLNTGGAGVVCPQDVEPPLQAHTELNYAKILNRVLPPDIRVLAWCPVQSGYSARFDCCGRTYKYFFPRGSLDIELMNEAAQYLVGKHDFRNFCTMDVANGVVDFRRSILSFTVSPLCCDYCTSAGGSDSNNRDHNNTNDSEVCQPAPLSSQASQDPSTAPASVKGRGCTGPHPASVEGRGCTGPHPANAYDMIVATIEAKAFLYHQVRMMMAVLFLVGEGKEDPTVVPQLLDVQSNPRKPQYCMASDLPLCLYNTSFEGTSWQWDQENLYHVLTQLQGLWAQHSVRTTMIRRMLWDLEGTYAEVVSGRGDEAQQNKREEPACSVVQNQCAKIVEGSKMKVYKPLLSRQTGESLESRVDHYIRRGRIDPTILQKNKKIKSEELSKEHK